MATEKNPSTIDEFCFWTKSDLIINPFDVVCVNHIDNSTTYGVVEEISHITDSESYLSNYLSSDFGSLEEGTSQGNSLRVGMYCVKARVTGNSKNLYTPVHEGALVSSANEDQIREALGLKDDESEHMAVVGFIDMYEGSQNIEKVTIPVKLDRRFLVGPEGAHLNISGISGLAAKTSYAMFILNALRQNIGNVHNNDSAYIFFNVKGCDLLAIDEAVEDPNKTIAREYDMLKLKSQPFNNVHYLYPRGWPSEHANSFVPKEQFSKQSDDEKASIYSFTYEDNRDDIDLLFADIDDSTQTIESIISLIQSDDRFDNDTMKWKDFIDELEKNASTGSSKNTKNKEITVASWRKFTRIVKKTVKTSSIFASARQDAEINIVEKIRQLKSGDILVIDIAKLSEREQAYVFGSVMRAVTDLRFMEKAPEAPDRIVTFVDELNKYASSDLPKNSPIVKELLDVAERGRSLGIVLFAAEQFRSAIHDRIKGNCSTHAYGRTNAIEISKPDYKYIPAVYKNMMTRLKQGEYILQNPTLRSVLKIRFPRPCYKQFK